MIKLDDHRPGYLIHTGTVSHFIPKQCLQDIIDGKLAVTELDDYRTIIPQVIKEWMAFMEKEP